MRATSMGDMTQTPHPDDQPAEQWRRLSTDEEGSASLPEFSLQDPTVVGTMFVRALGNPRENFNALSQFATPESLSSFGNFTSAADLLESIGDWGFSPKDRRALGDDAVAYFEIHRGVPQSYEVLDPQPMMPAAVLTLVWRPEFGRWMVHAIGAYVRPEDVPH